MAKCKTKPQIAPPDPDQIMLAGVAPVSMIWSGSVAAICGNDLRLAIIPSPLNIRRRA